jgi:hypothetical protein
VIWAVLDRPPDYEPCNEDPPPGQPAELREFRIPAYVLTLIVWGYGVARLLGWSREARARRGLPAQPGWGALATAALSAVFAVALGIDTFNVSGPDTGSLGFAIVLGAFFWVVPIALLGLSLLAMVVSLIGPADRWRSWLDRTGPLALGAVLLVAIPVLYGIVLFYGGDATIC